MKPGPPRLCDCGKCPLCKRRKSHSAYYRRNAERIIKQSAEYRRRRKDGPKPVIKLQSKADDDLDRKAAEWLAERR